MDEDRKNSKNAGQRSMTWKHTQIEKTSDCRCVRLSTDFEPKEIVRLVYHKRGFCIVALASNGSHHAWRLSSDKATIYDVRRSVTPPRQELINDVVAADNEMPVHCLVLSRAGCYALSSSGGRITAYNLYAWQILTHLTVLPALTTALALYPNSNNIIAIGMSDSSILLYNGQFEVAPRIMKLPSHFGKITGLAFSMELNVLVSIGSEGLINVWSTVDWKLKNSKFLQLPWSRSPVPLNPSLQFHNDEVQFLVAHPTQLCIYEATNLDRKNQWFADESYAPITCATFSCDCALVYSTFLDGIVGIFCASNLHLQCVVHPSAYRPTPTWWCEDNFEAIVVAANPKVPNEFAIGLSNGEVIVLEPPLSKGKWGVAPPVEIIESTKNMPRASSSGASCSGAKDC